MSSGQKIEEFVRSGLGKFKFRETVNWLRRQKKKIHERIKHKRCNTNDGNNFDFDLNTMGNAKDVYIPKLICIWPSKMTKF